MLVLLFLRFPVSRIEAQATSCYFSGLRPGPPFDTNGGGVARRWANLARQDGPISLGKNLPVKIPATAIALVTVLASPVYAITAHPRHTATFNNQARGHNAVIRNPKVFLLENRGAGSTNQVSDFQSNWDVSY
jgi:hypothetical protein